MSLKGKLSRLFEPLTGYWTAPGSPVRLRKPPGFEPTDAFPGLIQPAGAGSIMVQVLPASYAEMSAGFTPEAVLKQGIGLHDDEAVEVDGHPGRLIRVSQSAGDRDFDKWILMLELGGHTALVMATYPSEDALSLSALLRETLLGAMVSDTAAGAKGPSFRLGQSPRLKKATAWGGMSLYTPDGRFTPGEPGPAVFLAGWGSRSVPEPERQRFATNHIGQVDNDLMGVSVTSQRDVTLDGLPGYETQAVGRSRQDGQERALYEVILFAEGRYVVLTGHTEGTRAHEFVPAFQALAAGFRL